jgi:hypothetical protein
MRGGQDMTHSAEKDVPTQEEREALDRASSVFGWQHLARYSGMSAEWLNLTLLAIVRSALAAHIRVGESVAATLREHWFHDGGDLCDCGYWAHLDSVKRHHIEDALTRVIPPGEGR